MLGSDPLLTVQVATEQPQGNQQEQRKEGQEEEVSHGASGPKLTPRSIAFRTEAT